MTINIFVQRYLYLLLLSYYVEKGLGMEEMYFEVC